MNPLDNIQMTGAESPYCDICGLTWTQRAGESVSVIGRHGEPPKITCGACERFIESGMLRPETVDGVQRWRWWHMGGWTPGELHPRPTQVV